MRPKVVLRLALPEDAAVLTRHRVGMWRAIGHHSIRAIDRHAAPYRRWLRPRLKSGEVVAYLATVEGQVAGSGTLWFMPQEPRPGIPQGVIPYIMSMYTQPEHQRQGIASAIVRELLRVARRSGAVRVTLHAAPQGRPVYERLGFEPTAEMRLWFRRPAWAGPPHARPIARARAGPRR
ncbi:MAG: GNAT family N-acetyltransferase [Thermoplasmata archaeon]|nr:GNAT family N-acetyltransferase [Thermoplasmata archaeon]